MDQILDYLTGLGHKRICFIVNEPRNLLITSLRAEAVQKKLQERGLTKSQLVYCDTPNWGNSFDAAYKKVAELLAAKPAPTAVVPLSGVGAWAIMRYVMENHIKVPEQLSVVSFDPMVNNDILPIPLTQLVFSRGELVERALKLLWSDEASTVSELVTPQLQIHASTAPPNPANK